MKILLIFIGLFIAVNFSAKSPKSHTWHYDKSYIRYYHKNLKHWKVNRHIHLFKITYCPHTKIFNW